MNQKTKRKIAVRHVASARDGLIQNCARCGCCIHDYTSMVSSGAMRIDFLDDSKFTPEGAELVATNTQYFKPSEFMGPSSMCRCSKCGRDHPEIFCS